MSTRLSDQAVCIRHWDFSETSQTVSLFLRDHGLVRGLAKGSKQAKGRFSGGIGLLSRGHVQAIVKSGRDLATITEWDLLELYPALSRNLASHYAGLYFADLIQHLFSEADPHPDMFDCLTKSLAALPDSGSVENRLLAFQWTALVEAGFRPVLDHDAQTGETFPDDAKSLGFSAGAGGTVVDDGRGDRWRVRTETIVLLRRVADGSHDEAAHPSDQAVGRANLLLAAYLRAIMDREPATMRAVFGKKLPATTTARRN
ncbi:MAG: DNA repair protein RecO [Planctomycetes bacterium]|nr:DNA repair protein RecO [Planctomycetota bacterium]NOG55362.1 DNA repair protein RecO [Planctomycetota bacterium]